MSVNLATYVAHHNKLMLGT